MFGEYGALRAGGIIGSHSYLTEEAERGQMEIGAGGMRFGGIVEPYPYLSEEAEKGRVFSPYAGAMIGYPHEEAERGMAFHVAVGMRAGYQSEEALLKKEYLPLERELGFIPHLVLFEKIKKERALEEFGEVLYGRSEKPVEPFGELKGAKKEVIRKLVDINLGKYMVDRVETFKKKEESESLQPKDVLEIFSIKKIAGETGWGDMLTEIKKIEKGYYKDCSTIPEMFEKTLRSGKAMTVKEAEDMLNRIYEFAEKHNISFTSPLIKNQIKILEMEMDL